MMIQVRHGQGQSAAAAAFSDEHSHCRRPQSRHAGDGPGDGLTLAACLRFDARVSSRRVDKGDHRRFETSPPVSSDGPLFCSPPDSACRSGRLCFPQAASLLLADDRHRPAVEKSPYAAYDTAVLSVEPVSMQRKKSSIMASCILLAVGRSGCLARVTPSVAVSF